MANFEPRGSVAGDLTTALTYYKASNGVTITEGNAVTLVGGYVENLADSGEPLLGVAASTVVGDANSTEVGVYCDPNLVYYNDADGNLTNADVGKVFRTTGSGSTIDQSTGAVNTAYAFVCIKRNPNGDNASEGLFKPYRTQLLSNQLDT